MQMEAGLDTGPVLARQTTPISAEDTAATLHDRLSDMSAELMIETLSRLEKASLRAECQPSDGVTYAAKIDKAEARINWSLSSEQVAAHIRGLSPFPGAWTEIAGQRVKVLMADVAPDVAPGTPGEVRDGALAVSCGTGVVRLTTLQRAGKAATVAESFLRGFPVSPGTQLD